MSRFGFFSVPYFLALRQSTNMYSVNLYIRCKYGTIQTRKDSRFWHFLRSEKYSAQKMNFSIKDFFSKCVQIRSFYSRLLKKSLMEKFIFVQWSNNKDLFPETQWANQLCYYVDERKTEYCKLKNAKDIQYKRTVSVDKEDKMSVIKTELWQNLER